MQLVSGGRGLSPALDPPLLVKPTLQKVMVRIRWERVKPFIIVLGM